jgi:hypothetical protein
VLPALVLALPPFEDEVELPPLWLPPLPSEANVALIFWLPVVDWNFCAALSMPAALKALFVKAVILGRMLAFLGSC